MKQSTIAVGSVTNAMRGKQVLENHGYSVQIQRLTHMDDQNGCGYQLLVNGDVARAVELLRSSGVRVNNGGKRP